MNDITSTSTSNGRDRSGQFVLGHKWSVGHGRPRGARDRHSRNFLEAYAADFELHGPQVIEQVRREKPEVYLKIAADLLPKHAELDVNVDVFHNATSVLEAFRMASELVGADPDRALGRLRRHAPHLIDHDNG
jgi:hypothetical protein